MAEAVESILISGAEAVGIQLNRQMVKRFLLYLHELKQWNQKFNLTSLHNDREIIIDHFIDCLSVIPYLPLSGSLIDIGSGAGFPGLPIKIVRPQLTVTLLEAQRKKVNFLRQIILLLDLSNIMVLHERAESLLSGNKISGFDMVIARAFSSFEKLLKMVHPWLIKGSTLIAMKGTQGDRELIAAENLMNDLSVGLVNKVELQLPESMKKRVLYFIMKN